MKSEGDPVQMNWIIQFYPKIGLDSALLGTSQAQTKKFKCIGSNMVNHAQNLMSVKIFFVLPNKLIPSLYVPPIQDKLPFPFPLMIFWISLYFSSNTYSILWKRFLVTFLKFLLDAVSWIFKILFKVSTILSGE